MLLLHLRFELVLRGSNERADWYNVIAEVIDHD
jgi:hypothetical protein